MLLSHVIQNHFNSDECMKGIFLLISLTYIYMFYNGDNKFSKSEQSLKNVPKHIKIRHNQISFLV